MRQIVPAFPRSVRLHLFHLAGNAILVAQAFPQLPRAIPEFPMMEHNGSCFLLEGAYQRLLDEVRRVHVRLSALKLVNRCSRGSQLHYAVANIYDVRKTNFIEPLCEAKDGFGRGHCLQ